MNRLLPIAALLCLTVFATAQKSADLVTYSKFDFIPGEKIVVFEDFLRDSIGDFPAKWNTNATGEIVTAAGFPGRFLMISKKGRYIPTYITNLPDNFTLQFDVMANENFSYSSPMLQLSFLTVKNDKQAVAFNYFAETNWSAAKVGILPANPGNTGGSADIQVYKNAVEQVKNELETRKFSSANGRGAVKVSLWRQKERLRVYLDEEKIFDISQAFAAGQKYNTIMFELFSDVFNENDRYLISNLTLAAGTPDTRNKLINEGKFSTTGILFDVNSDKIKPESYGALKDIATVLNENPTVKVLIVGHTDSDGSDVDNLALSKRRAESVKYTLRTEFKIDASRITTGGKGELQPADKNTTPEGRANNRRVEFIKQ